jgi:hypothetical protein
MALPQINRLHRHKVIRQYWCAGHLQVRHQELLRTYLKGQSLDGWL